MKAVVWNHYGSADELTYKEVEKPIIKEKEILIRVHASTVTAGDCEIRALKFPFFLKWMLRLYFGFLRPKDVILGQELSGEVVEVGQGVAKFKVGDQVFGSSGLRLGGYGEYVALPEKTQTGIITHKPEFISYEEAAAMPVGGMEALHLLKASQVAAGSRILINGAGGSIGTAAIQIAKDYGAQVTAVDSEEKLDMMINLGADQALDYTRMEFTSMEEFYDVIIDIVGTSKIFKSFSKLNDKGIYLVANPKFRHKLLSLATKLFGSKKMIVGIASHTEEGLSELLRLYGEGLLKIEIDKVFPLKDVVEAHHYVEAGLKKGNVVIAVKESK